MDIALFSPSSLFAGSDGNSSEEEKTENHEHYEERKHQFPGTNGTGALAIFLKNSFQLDITTSDYDDGEIEGNIAYNCRINGVTPVLPHIRHSWGDVFPISEPDWDLIIASDILLCKCFWS
ncbi:hypothetical protein OROHE_023878 [Orobanche hederae]